MSLGARLRRRWGLVLLTVLGASFAVTALSADWLSSYLIISPVDAQERTYGVGHFGVWGVGFAVGVVLLAVLVAAAVVLPERLGLVVAFAALAVTVILAGDLLYLGLKLGEARALSGEAAARLVESFPGDRYRVWFLIMSPGLINGSFAVALLGVVAAQLPRPDLAPRIVAALGAAAGLVSLAAPWATAYLPVGGELRISRYWLWSVSPAAVGLLVAGLALVGLGVVVTLLPRVSVPLLVAVVVVGVVVVNGPWLLDAPEVVERQLAARSPMSVAGVAAARFLEIAALLVTVAAVRAWWRGRRADRGGGPADQPAPAVAGSPPWRMAR